jgi:hypothetical protein
MLSLFGSLKHWNFEFISNLMLRISYLPDKIKHSNLNPVWFRLVRVRLLFLDFTESLISSFVEGKGHKIIKKVIELPVSGFYLHFFLAFLILVVYSSG